MIAALTVCCLDLRCDVGFGCGVVTHVTLWVGLCDFCFGFRGLIVVGFGWLFALGLPWGDWFVWIWLWAWMCDLVWLLLITVACIGVL